MSASAFHDPYTLMAAWGHAHYVLARGPHLTQSNCAPIRIASPAGSDATWFKINSAYVALSNGGVEISPRGVMYGVLSPEMRAMVDDNDGVLPAGALMTANFNWNANSSAPFARFMASVAPSPFNLLLKIKPFVMMARISMPGRICLVEGCRHFLSNVVVQASVQLVSMNTLALPSVGMSLSSYLTLTIQNQSWMFFASISAVIGKAAADSGMAQQQGLTITVGLANTINHVFGLRGLSVGHMYGSISLVPFNPPINAFALRGTVTLGHGIGKLTGTVAVGMKIPTAETYLYAHISQVTLHQLCALVQLPVSKLPEWYP
jgi:hypothetical protein